MESASCRLRPGQWDRDVQASIVLENLIPNDYFRGYLAKDNTTYSLTTRVMKGATKYINDIDSERKRTGTYAPVTTAISPPFIRDSPDIANLRQAAERCLAKAEEKMEEAVGLEGELKKVVQEGFEQIVAITDMLEQGGATFWMKLVSK